MNTKLRVQPSALPQSAPAFNPDDLLSLQEVASRLKTDVGWIREKVRRRCPNPMPVYNMGRALIFSWAEVCEWIRKCPRPIHAAHKRRRAKQAKAA